LQIATTAMGRDDAGVLVICHALFLHVGTKLNVGIVKGHRPDTQPQAFLPISRWQ